MAIEDAYELQNYLPLSYMSTKEQEYIAFLWDAFETNYNAAKYQFAFLAYHMLTMAFVYFNVWQIRQHRAGDFGMAMVGFNKDLEKELLDATSPFTFWRVNESGIMRFMKLIGCDNGKCGTYAKLVQDRNETAHCNGNIFYSDADSLDEKIAEVLRVVDEIQKHSKPIIEECYRSFLVENHDLNEREFTDPDDQIREILIHANYFAQADIDICAGFDVTSLVGDPNYAGIQALHQALLDKYAPPAGGVGLTAIAVPPAATPIATPPALEK